MAKMIDEDDCPEGLPGWLATFGDLMSLLLTFFVLLLSFSSTEEIKFKNAMGSLKASLGVFESDPEMSQPIRVTLPMVRGSIRQSQNIRKSAENLEKTLSEEGLEGDVSLLGTSSGLVIRIQAPVLYDVGGAELKPEISKVLMDLGNLLREFPNQVVVQGHTDNVVRFLITETLVMPTRLAAEGYGEYRPIATNATPEGRRKNRRVEILILYAGEEDGNLEILTEAFKGVNMDATRDDGSPIIKQNTRRRRRP